MACVDVTTRLCAFNVVNLNVGALGFTVAFAGLVGLSGFTPFRLLLGGNTAPIVALALGGLCLALFSAVGIIAAKRRGAAGAVLRGVYCGLVAAQFVGALCFILGFLWTTSGSLFQARRGWHDQDDPVGDLRARMTPWAQKYVACQYAGCCRLGYEALAPTTTTANTDAGADVSGQATTTIRPHDSAPDWIRRTYDDLGNPYDDRGSAPPSSFDYGKIEKVRYADGSIVPVAVHRAQSSCPSGAWAMNVLVPGGRPCGPILYDRV